MMKTAVIATLLVFAATLCGARPRGQENEQQKEVLKYAIEEDGNLLTGGYYRRDLRLGLRFRMTRDSMALETWDRRPLISFGDKMNSRTARLVEFMGSQFLQLRKDGNRGFFGIQRQGNRKMVSSDLESESGMPMNRIMEKNRMEIDYESVVTKLLAMPEAQLIVELAEAMGSDGVTGKQVPASLNFYALAMRINKFLIKQKERQQRSVELNNVEIDVEHTIKKRYYSDGIVCENDPIGPKCLGLCGPGCTCWSWVCGDCCYNEGCYQHDLCCENSYFDVDCFGVWDFTCDSYSC